MAFSINVNAGALSALRNLSDTNNELNTTQTRINTGLEVSSARDNAAVFSIAQKLRGDLRGLSAVDQSLDRGISATDVALAAATAISDLLLELKEKAVAASDQGLDTSSRNALAEDFQALRDQITSITANAEFNGTNLIDSGSDAIVAITNSDATQTLSVAHENLTLGSSNIVITATQGISTQTTAADAVTDINQAIDNLNAVLTRLGSGATALEQSRDFNARLSDVIEVGIGNLVDADLATESANLQALQVRQQLGIQALSIANQSPQQILSLFQG
ncbi:flagellin [Kordiimonas sp. SCSIO 12603]|uniref:flagellin n=1 Tax=Kordiimonas sp. SCSIO 12603 TaxID=2829596 RepID=UPI002108166E|nr:flagellin [Kordiimonas sp. SCSIO 12603]UTW57617.1 flagellin [Kordiimonas sp. SCSIO 12603]